MTATKLSGRVSRFTLGICAAGAVGAFIAGAGQASAAPSDPAPPITPVVSSSVVADPTTPPATLTVSVRDSYCADGHTTVDLAIRGAVRAGQYRLVGTSAYPASDPFTAPASDFSVSVQINHGYLGFTGDAESSATGQVSNTFSVPNRCPPPHGDPGPSPLHTTLTFTDVLTVAPSTSAAVRSSRPHTLTMRPVASPTTSLGPSSPLVSPSVFVSPASLHRSRSSSTLPVALAVGVVLLVGGAGGVAFAVQRRRTAGPKP